MTKRLFPLLTMLATVAASGPAAWSDAEPAAQPRLDPELPYQAEKADPVTYDVDFIVTVTAPYHTKLLKVWLPLPQTDAGQEVQERAISTFPLSVEPRVGKEKTFGNTFAYFEFAHPEGAQVIRHRFKVKVWELHWHLGPARVAPVERWPASFDRYLGTDQSVVVDERLRTVAREVVPERHGAGRDLADVMAWVNGHMKYDHANASLRASSEHALRTGAGHCSDYHGLCAAFGRALGCPTRVTYGINTLPKNSPSHCKMEAFLSPYGWVSFDLSETQNLIAAIKKDAGLDAEKKEELVRAATARLRQGFRDNTWFLQTRGTDYDLAPPAGRRLPVVRTLYAEADGIALPEPDPANPNQRAFAWMTAHRYTPDRPVTYPFKDWKSLQKKQ
jgi:transglutaminase-like putative cysteine protease